MPRIVLALAVAMFASGFGQRLEAQDCWNCEECEFVGHKLPNTNPAIGSGYMGAHNWCNTDFIWCDESHPECSGSALLDAKHVIEEVRLAVARSDLESILVAYNELVVLNLERNAVQILGCGDQVVANLPVSEAIEFVLPNARSRESTMR